MWGLGDPPLAVLFQQKHVVAPKKAALSPLIGFFTDAELYDALQPSNPSTGSRQLYNRGREYGLVSAMYVDATTSPSSLAVIHRDPSDAAGGLIVRTQHSAQRKTLAGALALVEGSLIIYAHYARTAEHSPVASSPSTAAVVARAAPSSPASKAAPVSNPIMGKVAGSS